MKMLTFKDWKLGGFHVKKGETATKFNAKGEALFSRNQVESTKAFDLNERENNV
jgi:hypothetical protein